MSDVTIFVEGPSDQKFVHDLILFHFRKDLHLGTEIQSFGGKDEWEKSGPFLKKSSESGKLNILVFDADSNFNERRTELINKRDELELGFDLFLFPDDQGSGDLETLLEKIAVTNSEAIFDCFVNYKNCIQEITGESSQLDLKTKIYAYSEILTGSGKEKDRDYTDSKVWDLNHEILNPLVEFLKLYFS